MNSTTNQRRSFARVILKMIGLTFRATPWAFSLFLLSCVIFTGLLIADFHFIRVLLDELPLFVDGKIAYKTVLLTVLLLGGVSVLISISNAFGNLVGAEYVDKKTGALMIRAMSEKAARLELIRFESTDLYEGIEKATHGVDLAFDAMERVVFSIIFHGGYFLFLSVYLAWFKPMLVLGIFLSFLPVALSRYIRASAFYKAESRVVSHRREFKHYEECLTDRTYFKETRTRGAVPFFRGLYDRALASYNKEMWRTEVRTGRIDLGLKVLTLLGYGGLLFMLVHYLLRGEISPGMFGAVYFAMDSIFKWFEELFNRLGSAYQDAALVGNFFDFMDLPERNDGTGTVRRDRGVVMEGVCFRYPGVTQNAIDGVSLSIPHQQSVAIVGENGAGKSTLVRLITGMYQPLEGRVLIGDVDTRDASAESSYEGLSAVFQNYQRYAMTLADNVSISEPVARSDGDNESRTLSALTRAGLAATADSFPEGASTMLSREFGGTDLSGGQWQRVAIARGLYRSHDMIILDEPTAAIDPLEETALYKRFVEVAAGRTAIIVTHRLGSARIADRILVMDGGRLVEDGTHEQLMTQQGTYAMMFESQAKWYDGQKPQWS
jgi:ATP-binding cassette, subfamily B, bacterial